jgi:hypothetical protein
MSTMTPSERLKQAAAEVTLNAKGSGEKKPLAPLAEGRYAAFVEKVESTTFKTGSKGYTITYCIEQGPAKNRKIRDRIIITDKAGNETKYGYNNLSRFLKAAAVSADVMGNFKFPKNEHDLGDFRHALSAPVTIQVKADGEWEGRPNRKVAGVYERSAE